MTSTLEASSGGAAMSDDLGTIGVRVVVLPKKAQASEINDSDEPSDLSSDENLSDGAPSPVASYLERPKGGKLCCVFLVNGQRHEGLDNSFIVQQLGFKYLRKRMMIIVDVDGLRPEVLGDLMQGSRQHFYQGRAWEAISSRLISSLKGDPDLKELEEEAEAELAELAAGDQKVKDALDSLIEAHHQFSDHVVLGAGLEAGTQDSDGALGAASQQTGSFVTFVSPDKGAPSEYPVLVSSPSAASLWIQPGIARELSISCRPNSAWPAIASLDVSLDTKVPELHIAESRSDSALTLGLRFDPPDDFDVSDYPVRATLRVFARFNGIKEARRLAVALTMHPATEAPPPILFERPTWLKISTRQPVLLLLGATDSHVRVRWNGKDDLAEGSSPRWTFKATCVTPNVPAPHVAFSQPHKGRFSLLISLPAEAKAGDALKFELAATGPDGEMLASAFDAVVSEKAERSKPEPRLLIGDLPSGSSRRPPYVLKYVRREDWGGETCFGGDTWTDTDAGAYLDPTERQPLTLLINSDMGSLDAFRKSLIARKLSESEIKARLQKYQSHVAYHLYQMSQESQTQTASVEISEDGEVSSTQPTPQDQRAEIHRVAMTLLNLMQVARLVPNTCNPKARTLQPQASSSSIGHVPVHTSDGSSLRRSNGTGTLWA